MNGILMDGTTYKVRVVYNSLVRSFELRSGENEDYMISGRHERDLLGTGYAYQLAIYEKVARERWGRAQAGKPVPRIISELHFLQNNTSWSLEKHAQARAVDYYAEAIALCEAISHKTQESDFACRQYGEQGSSSGEENLQNAVTALAPCKYCPYNYVCNHK